MRKPDSYKRFRDSFYNKEVFLSFLSSYAMVLLVPFLVSVLFYHTSGNETQRYAVQLNNQVLVSASESLDQHLIEVTNIANEITYTPTVRSFHNNTSGFDYPHAYRMIEVRDSLEAYSLMQSFVSKYFLFFNNSRIVINNQIIYKYDEFFRDYLHLGDESEAFQADLESLRLRTGLIPARDITILETGGRYISLMQPLFSRGNGYLMILIDEDSVASLFRNINLGQTGLVYIAEGNGEMLTDSAGERCDLEELYAATIGHVTDNSHLRQLASEHRTLLRSSFTSRLLRGSFSSDAEATRVCQYVYPECMFFKRANVLLFHLQPLESLDSDDMPLKLLGSMKMVLKELLDRRLGHPLYYDIDEETLALIVFNRSKDALEALCAELYGEYTPYMRDCVRTYVGSAVTPPLPKIARSFENARAAMTMHALSPQPNSAAPIWSEASGGGIRFFYPPDVSYRLTDAVTRGDTTTVDQTLEELFQVNFIERPMTPALGRLFIAELLSTAVNCLPLIQNRSELNDDKCNEYLSAIQDAPPNRQFGLLRDFYQLLTKSAENTRQEGGAELISQVINYLDGHFHDSALSLAGIADTFSVNASVLSTSFKQQTGKNLSAYLEDLRIQEAQRMLRTTDMTINRIAEEVGYLSANTFCRAFRRNTGYNTSTYKTMNDAHTAQEEQRDKHLV